jgi:hypothetical protein
VTLLGAQYKSHPWILQYAVHVLEFFPVEQVFFYIPQMVQALRYDTSGNAIEFYYSVTANLSLQAMLNILF